MQTSIFLNGTIKNNSKSMKEEQIKDIVFKYNDSDERVFHPHPISRMMANVIDVKSDDIVLDLCTGSGIFAIVAAHFGAQKVFAVDLSPYSLKTAKNNALLNNIPEDKLEFIESDYFSNVPDVKFDKIYSNPPCMPICDECLSENEYFKLAVNGGYDGSFFYNKVINESISYLKPDGELIIPVPKWSNWKSIIYAIEQKYTYKVIAKDDVRYYLSDNSPQLKNCIKRLSDRGIIDVSIVNEEIYAEVLICKCIPKQHNPLSLNLQSK